MFKMFNKLKQTIENTANERQDDVRAEIRKIQTEMSVQKILKVK